MKKILITGGSGFFGKRLAQYYQDRYVICAPSHKDLDITGFENTMQIMRREHPDIVIHCAAISDVSQCEKDPIGTWRINVEGSCNISRASREIGAKCIICSTDAVYSNCTTMGPHSEDEILSPGIVYGIEKLISERVCLAEYPQCVLLRLSWMYDRNVLSANEHSQFWSMMMECLKRGENLKYPRKDQAGLTDVSEAVKNMEKVFDLPGGVYNYGAPNHEDTYDMMRKCFDAAGLNPNMIELCTSPHGSVRYAAMSQRKIQQYGIVFTPTQVNIVKNLKLFVNELKEKEKSPG